MPTLTQLQDCLQRGQVLLLDGAVGTELTRRGFETRLPLWSAHALRDEPGRELTARIHQDYAAAGARILLSNTFRANLLSAAERTSGIDLLERTAPPACWTAVSVGPLRDCYEPNTAPHGQQLQDEHAELARQDAERALVWFETIGTLREAEAVARLRRQHAPTGGFVLSMCVREDGHLLDGTPLAETVAAVEPHEPLAFGLNCIPPGGATRAVETLRRATDRPLAVYAHIGNPEPIQGWSFSEATTPDEYAAYARQWLQQGVQIVGGCCGTDARHIARLRAVL